MASSPFFSPDSFWNQPIPEGASFHPQNAHFNDLLRWSTKSPGLHINLHEWTAPIYFVDGTVPRVPVERRMIEDVQGATFQANSRPYLHDKHWLGHHPSFAGGVPIPDTARPDPEEDAHLVIVDTDTGRVWDMWGACRAVDGSWSSCTGMDYDLHGSGVFDPRDFPARNGESIHMYGPGRATGVPVAAGVILHEEIRLGRIARKLNFACRCSGLLAHYHPPAVWTDGGVPNGIPAGAVLQLDPAFDISGLEPAARTVARALQEFGAVLVDFAGGFTLAGQNLENDPSGHSWRGILSEEALFGLGFDHFRILAPETLGQTLVEKGMVPFPHRAITRSYRDHTGIES